MAKSLEQIQAQIDKLQKVAEALRAKEAAGIIVQVKALIAKYQLSAADLGFGVKGASVTPESGKAARRIKVVKKPRATATRTTRATKAAMALNGASSVVASAPGDVATQAAAKLSKGMRSAKASKPAKAPKAPKAPKAKPTTTETAAASKSPRKTKAAAKVLGPIKYRDEAGNEWTGRGTRPKWYLAALSSGKTAEQLLVQPQP